VVRKEKDDFLAVHELAAANCLIRVISVLFLLTRRMHLTGKACGFIVKALGFSKAVPSAGDPQPLCA
jgi:hypothetical protein